jgi:ribosomal protein S18 acetylase RimI-like enzyme
MNEHTTFRVDAFNPGNREDFFDFHSRVGGECFCTAWWVDSWEEWANTTAASNRTLRENLLSKGNYDGYLIYADDIVVGWCQVGLRDRLGKILHQFSLSFAPDTWAITCFQIDPNYRHQKMASRLLRAVIEHLRKKGIKRIEAYPKIDVKLSDPQQWTGKKNMYEEAGFSLVRENNSRAIFEIQLN